MNKNTVYLSETKLVKNVPLTYCLSHNDIIQI